MIVTLFPQARPPAVDSASLERAGGGADSGETIPEVYEVPYPALPPISVTLPGVRAPRGASLTRSRAHAGSRRGGPAKAPW